VLQLVSEQVGPSGQVVESFVSSCFSYYCLLCCEQGMRYIFEDENILSGGEL